MCRKRHSTPCKSFATSSCVGGFLPMSWSREQNISRESAYISPHLETRHIAKERSDHVNLEKEIKNPTNGGRHSSAWRLKTENPPWVLVSEAVSVLQKEWAWGLGCGGGRGSFSIAFSSCWWYPKHHKSVHQKHSIVVINSKVSTRNILLLVQGAKSLVQKPHQCPVQPTQKEMEKLTSKNSYCFIINVYF